MEKSVDTLRAEMWRDRYTAIFNQYRALAKREKIMREEYDIMAQDLDDLYQERCDLKEALLQAKEDSENYSHEVVELRLHCGKLEEKIDEYETRNSFLEAEQETTLNFDVSKLHQRCDTLANALFQKKLECNRLRACLKDMVDAGTQYLAFSQPISGADDSRETRFREVIETGRKKINE